MPNASDINLLFGILALQMDFISREALLEAMNGWVIRKETSLGEILCTAGEMDADERRLIDAIVAKHLENHDGDPHQSLAALSPPDPIRTQLARLEDTDIARSLGHVSTNQEQSDPHATWLHAVGKSTSHGARFRILRPHAEGGLGRILVARDQELQREVALKEIKPALADNPALRARFILEAEITGGLEHPGIVPVYGLGQYGDGRPYYAMRLIRGESLKVAIDRFHSAAANGGWRTSTRQFELRKILGRFIDICQAIEYAHSRGILHRDLKPGNIMLGKYGETLVVDWGLAKAAGHAEVGAGSEESTLQPGSGTQVAPTKFGLAIGTPAYMSPEQAAGQLDKLSQASDIYGLGATLYHLLTGRSPVSDSNLEKTIQRVRDGDIPPPREANARIPRPLAAICQQAMALDPARRYASAVVLADDIERWLANESVMAYRDKPWECVSRWFRKHRALALWGAAALLLVAIVSGSATLIIAAQNSRIKLQEREARFLAEKNGRLAADEKRARLEAETRRQEEARARAAEKLARERAEAVSRKNRELVRQERGQRLRAEQLARDNAALAAAERGEAQKARRLTEFLVGTFEAADPIGVGGIPFYIPKVTGEKLTVRQLLDRGHQRVNKELADQPEVLATVKNTIGNVYRSLGYLQEAEELLQSALESRRAMLPADHLDLAQSCHDLAWLYHERGDFARAEPLYREALKIRQQHGEKAALLAAASMQNLGWLVGQGDRPKEALEWFRKTLDTRKKLLGAKHRDTAVAQIGMAFCLIEGGQWMSAAPYIAAAQSTLLDLEGNPTLARAVIKALQGLLAYRTLGAKVAEKPLREGHQLMIELLGEHHIYTALVAFEHARCLDELGRDQEAEKCYRTALAIARDQVQMRHPRVRRLAEDFGSFLIRHGKPDEARSLWHEFLEAQASRFGTETLPYADAFVGFADMLQEIGDDEQAERTLRSALKVFDKTARPLRLTYLRAQNKLALLLLESDRDLDQVEATFRSILPHVQERFGAQSSESTSVQVNIARALMDQDKLDDAQELLRETESMGLKLWGKDRRLSLDYTYYWQSVLYRRLRRPADAVTVMRKYVALWPSDKQKLYDAASSFARCLSLLEKNPATGGTERERVAKLAIDTLAKAIDQGYKNVREVEDDGCWGALREQADFKAQLKRIAADKPKENANLH